MLNSPPYQISPACRILVDTTLTPNHHIPEGTYACGMKERPRFAYSTQVVVARNGSGVGVFELVYFFVEGPYCYKGRIRSYFRP